MKKIVLVALIVLLSGCYEESGKLNTICVKKEDVNTLYIETTYDISFKADVVENVEVIYYYNDNNASTISSIKTSINSNDQFIKELRRNIQIDNNKEFKVSYNIKPNDNEQILNRFLIKEKRSNLIKKLQEEGFECK